MKISNLMVTAAISFGSVLGVSSSVQAGYTCRDTMLGRQCSGELNGQSVNTTTRDTMLGRETTGTVGGEPYNVTCRETMLGTECN